MSHHGGRAQRKRRSRSHKNKDFVYFPHSRNPPKGNSTLKPKSTPVAQITAEEQDVIDYVNSSPKDTKLLRIEEMVIYREHLICLTSSTLENQNGWLDDVVSSLMIYYILLLAIVNANFVCSNAIQLIDAAIRRMTHMLNPDTRADGKVFIERASEATMLIRDGEHKKCTDQVLLKQNSLKGENYICSDMVCLTILQTCQFCFTCPKIFILSLQIFLPGNQNNRHWYTIVVSAKKRRKF